MYRFFLAIVTLLISSSASSQYLTYVYNGELVREIKYANYKGSPYLFKEWMPAAVKIGNQYFKSEVFNVDLYDNKPFFKVNDSVFAFRESINEFYIVRSQDTVLFKRGDMIHKQLGTGFIEIISTSPLVVKQMKTNLSEMSSYGTATKEYQFVNAYGYFSQDESGMRKMKLSKDEAQKVFKEQWNAIETYALNNKISFKTEEGWRALSKYYTTLK